MWAKDGWKMGWCVMIWDGFEGMVFIKYLNKDTNLKLC